MIKGDLEAVPVALLKQETEPEVAIKTKVVVVVAEEEAAFRGKKKNRSLFSGHFFGKINHTLRASSK